jgi:hypothetical protein
MLDPAHFRSFLVLVHHLRGLDVTGLVLQEFWRVQLGQAILIMLLHEDPIRLWLRWLDSSNQYAHIPCQLLKIPANLSLMVALEIPPRWKISDAS